MILGFLTGLSSFTVYVLSWQLPPFKKITKLKKGQNREDENLTLQVKWDVAKSSCEVKKIDQGFCFFMSGLFFFSLDPV